MSNNEPIRLLVADDHIIVRAGLRAFLETEPGINLVGEAADGAEAVRMVKLLRPDVIVLDLIMPNGDGLTAITAIRSADPAARILVLTSFSDDEMVISAIKQGALGYLLKDTSPVELVKAIRDVYHGEASLQPAIARKLIGEFQRPSEPSRLSTTTDVLTARENEVLALVAEGISNQQVAARLCITERTVRTHVSNILAKLHLENRTHAARYALREGIAHLDKN